MTETILPCPNPKCGDQPELSFDDIGDFVECASCIYRGPRVNFEDDGKSRAEAIRLHNAIASLRRHWKRFEDEVPTERRGVVVSQFDGDESSREWPFITETLNPYTPEYLTSGWIWSTSGADVLSLAPGAWRFFAEEHGYTHWIYIDPPREG